MVGESLFVDFARCNWDVVAAIIGEDKNDVVADCGGGIRWEEVPVGEGRFVHVCDGLNAEVQADPSSRQSNVLRVVQARRCCILQWMLVREGEVEQSESEQ